MAGRLGEFRSQDTRRLGFTVGDGVNDATMTFTGTLDQINEGYEAMRQGHNIRGIVVND